MKNTVKIFLLIFGLAIFLTACFEEPQINPVLGDSSTFESGELLNDETADPIILEPEMAEDTIETFDWTKADFGVNIPTNYALEVSGDDQFSSLVVLATSAGNSAPVTGDQLNDAYLNLGLIPYEENTLHFRVKTITQVDTLFSATVSRIVTGYRLSECGNFCTVGVIGSATPGGWDNDTDMRLADVSGVDKSTWTTTLYLNSGEIKFRASDNWDTNWGAGGALGGANIPIASTGYYKLTFNDQTGVSSIDLLDAPTFPTIGVIGDATPGGWDNDTDLTQDPDNQHIWTGTITLGTGFAKFRANNAWDVNWGGGTFPSGYGTRGGSDIAVEPGTYSVWFHDVTGQYMFLKNATVFNTIGVIGDATPGGWDNDTDLIKNPSNPYQYSGIVTIGDGEAKFRANDSWDFNWGASDFPVGIGTHNGPNIPVSSGEYVVSFNSGTGEYWFLK